MAVETRRNRSRDIVSRLLEKLFGLQSSIKIHSNWVDSNGPANLKSLAPSIRASALYLLHFSQLSPTFYVRLTPSCSPKWLPSETAALNFFVCFQEGIVACSP